MTQREPLVRHTGSVLEPTLTKFDKRVLAALDPEPDYGQPDARVQRDFRDAWEIARRMREDDVALVRRTLRGLERFGYCWSRKWGWGQTWVATSRAQEVL